MCNTNVMKKVVFLLPIALLMTSCFNVTFVSEQHSAGIEGGGSISQNAHTESYTFFSGDPITTEGKSTATLTFASNSGESLISAERVNELANCDVDSLFTGAVEASNVGTREGAWLFVGAQTSYNDGYLTLAFTTPIKDIQIEAAPYYYINQAWNEDSLEIDKDVCIAVNTSNYIKLSSATNTEGTAVNSTFCRYHFLESQSQIKIKVGGARAFLKNITLYY